MTNPNYANVNEPDPMLPSEVDQRAEVDPTLPQDEDLESPDEDDFLGG